MHWKSYYIISCSQIIYKSRAILASPIYEGHPESQGRFKFTFEQQD